MPRSRFKPNSEYPYLVTARSRNQEWYSLPMGTTWDIFNDYLYLVEGLYNLEIHSFILMSNHFHMILRTPNANLDKAMNYFMREVSKEICRVADRKNQIFGGPYHRSLLTQESYYMNAYKYLYQNPTRAGICKYVQDYQYSTLAGLLGLTRFIIPVKGESLLTKNPIGTLTWLNERMDQETKEAIRYGLKKNEFKISQNKLTGKIAELEVPLFD
jgi:REP-associated tyrosine transposase